MGSTDGRIVMRWREYYRMDLKAYREWVASLRSAMSGEGPCECHHIKGIGHLSGGSMKAPDQFSMPWTDEEHRNFHDGRTHPSVAWVQWEYVARTQGLFIGELCRALGEKEMKRLVELVHENTAGG